LDSAKEMLESEMYDIVLFVANFNIYDLENINNSTFSYISDKNEIINNKETIYKYYSITKLYEKICLLYEKKKNRIMIKKNTDEQIKKETEIITFLPIHGGAGSSTIAAACAISLSADSKVLYINLEQISSCGDGKSHDDSGNGNCDVFSICI